MAWPTHPAGFFGQTGDDDIYKISRSLRFNSADSAFLSRNFTSPTDQDVFTFSLWAKLGVLGTTRNIFGVSTNHRFGLTSGNALNLTFAGTSELTTTKLLRDPSAWYHIMWVQSGTNHTIYVNGENSGTATATSSTFNTGVSHQLGAANSANHFNGYLTEVHFIDGQALSPGFFGETQPSTGRWMAKKYNGTYGLNGFYLDFSDNSGATSTTLGKDGSGNNNDWSPSGLSVAAGSGNDSYVDTPSHYGLESGSGATVRGNYCILDPISSGTTVTLANGNLDYSSAVVGQFAIASFGLTSGKWYWEIRTSAGTTETRATVARIGAFSGQTFFPSSYYSLAANNTDYGFRFDADAGTLEYTTNGTSYVSLATGLTQLPYFPYFNNNGTTAKTVSVNFGQRPFAYSIPTGFNSINTFNLPEPPIKKPSKYFDVVTYTGTGSAFSPTSTLEFSPDLVWIKGRSGNTNHALYTSVTGATQELTPNNQSSMPIRADGLTSFDGNGFTIGTRSVLNTNTATYVAWCMKQSAVSGFQIPNNIFNFSRRPTSSPTSSSHNLGVIPKMMIIRNIFSAQDSWTIYHENASPLGSSHQGALFLDKTDAYAGSNPSPIFNTTAPTSTNYTVGTSSLTGGTGYDYIDFIFAEVNSFSRFSSYSGNGNSNGPYVWCGFRPAFVMTKRTDGTSNWTIFDNKRSGANVDNDQLYPNLSDSESTSDIVDFLSSGFKLRSSDASVNATTGTYAFAAFAETPFKYARAR